MKTVLKLAAVAGLASLGACNRTPAENHAANVESAVDNAADHLDALAGNTSNAQAAEAITNSAARLRDDGQNAADTIRQGGSTNNVEANTVGM
jgi:hypothetical protein